MRFALGLSMIAVLAACSASENDAATGGTGAAPGTGGSTGTWVPGGGNPVTPDQYGVATQRSITVAGTPRNYWVVVTTDYSDSTPAALVFAWHGLSQTFPQTTEWLGVVGSATNAVLVYPVAQNPAEGFDPFSTGPDFALFDALLAEMLVTYHIDPARVFSLGHSNGGDINVHLGCERAEQLRRVANVSMFWSVPPGPIGACVDGAGVGMGWLFLYGVQDAQVNPPAIPTAVTNALGWMRNVNGCDFTETPTPVPVGGATCDDYLACTASASIRWCSHPGGHDWPSPTANQLIWDFFQAAP